MELAEPQAAPAPYGRACTTCARAKVKCMMRTEGGSCVRCHRLNKDCQPSSTIRKRTSKRASSSRGPALEERLDELVTLLRSQTVVNNTTVSSDGAGNHLIAGAEGVDQSSSSSIHEPSIATSNVGDTIDPASIASSIPISPSSSSAPSVAQAQTISHGHGCFGLSSHTSMTSQAVASAIDPFFIVDSISAEDASESLRFFRETYVSSFHFVYLPETMTPQDMRRKWPFFWLAIVSITRKSISQGILMGQGISQIISQKLIIGNERSLDLLLMLICFVSWAHYHKKNRPYLIVHLHLAMAVISDLGINGHPCSTGSSYWMSWRVSMKEVPGKERSIEEKRALLSVYLLSLVISKALNKMDTLKWSPYMESCLQELMEKPQWEGDVVLAVQVRCFLIIEQMVSSPWQIDGMGSGTPPDYYVKTLLAQLQEIKRSIPSNYLGKGSIIRTLSSTEFSIHEVAINIASMQSLDLQKLSHLQGCLNAIEAWLNSFLSMPPIAFAGLTMFDYFEMSHSIMSLTKLMYTRLPGWDGQAVRQRVDPVAKIDQFCDYVEGVPRIMGRVNDSQEEDIFILSANMMRQKKEQWAIEIASKSVPHPAVDEATDDQALNTYIDFSDDIWMGDLFSI